MRVLAWAVGTEARYIGMIGSKRKVISVYKALEKEGFAPEKFERVHAPVGLEIGALTPEEIAVSITAELIAVRRNAPKPAAQIREAFRSRSSAQRLTPDARRRDSLRRRIPADGLAQSAASLSRRHFRRTSGRSDEHPARGRHRELCWARARKKFARKLGVDPATIVVNRELAEGAALVDPGRDSQPAAGNRRTDSLPRGPSAGFREACCAAHQAVRFERTNRSCFPHFTAGAAIP